MPVPAEMDRGQGTQQGGVKMDPENYKQDTEEIALAIYGKKMHELTIEQFDHVCFEYYKALHASQYASRY